MEFLTVPFMTLPKGTRPTCAVSEWDRSGVDEAPLPLPVETASPAASSEATDTTDTIDTTDGRSKAKRFKTE